MGDNKLLRQTNLRVFGNLAINPKAEKISSNPGPIRYYNLDEVISNHISRVLAIFNGKVYGDGGAADLHGAIQVPLAI